MTSNSKKNRKTIALCISLPAELLPLVDLMAAEQGRTRSAFLSWLIKKAAEKN